MGGKHRLDLGEGALDRRSAGVRLAVLLHRARFALGGLLAVPPQGLRRDSLGDGVALFRGENLVDLQQHRDA